MIFLPRSGFRRSEWKNGGGVTHEVIRVPDADDFQWRLSVAEIARSGPFSDFTGYSRAMVLLAGNGLRLQAPDADIQSLNAPGDLIRFDGATRMECKLIEGPCTDLNLMVADVIGDARATVRVGQMPFAVPGPTCQTRIVFAVRQAIALKGSGGSQLTLSPWDAAVCTAQDGEVICGSESASACVFLAAF